MPALTRIVSLTNFAVATSALGFQVFVLYPWHKELDDRFEELKKEHVKVLEVVQSGKIGELQAGNQGAMNLKPAHTGDQGRKWWWWFTSAEQTRRREEGDGQGAVLR